MKSERLERLFEYADVLEKLSNGDTVLTNEKLELIREIKTELELHNQVIEKINVGKNQRCSISIESANEGSQVGFDGPLKILVLKG